MKGNKFSRDQILGAMTLVLGICITAYASTLKPLLEGLGEPGPKLFPMICGVGMILCSIALLLRKPKEGQARSPFATKEGWIRMGVLYLVLVAYVFIGLEFIGYLISTFVLLTTLFMMLAEERDRPKLWVAALIALVITIIMYVGFVKLVGVPMPKGVILPALGINL